MDGSVFQWKKVDTYSCKICHSDFCPVNLARAEFMFAAERILSPAVFLLNCVDCILNTRKLNIDLYKTCLCSCGSVDHSHENYLTRPWLATIYAGLATSFPLVCNTTYIKKKMHWSCSIKKETRYCFCSMRFKLLDSAEIACLIFLSYAMNRYVHIRAKMLKCTCTPVHWSVCTHTELETWNRVFSTQIIVPI